VAPPAVIELEIAGKVGLRIPPTTPPTLAAAIVKALGVS
jgi:transposase